MALLSNSKLQVSRIFSGVIIFIFVIFALYKLSTYSKPEVIPQETSAGDLSSVYTIPSNSSNNVGSWTFDASRDARDFALSDEQCSAAFPKLYTDINRMVQRYQNKPITKKQIDSQPLEFPRVKAMIFDGELIVLSEGGLSENRNLASLHAIQRALTALRPSERVQVPNCEFVLHAGDKPDPGEVVWGYTKIVGEPEFEQSWLMPDFGFYTWAEVKVAYSQIRREIQSMEVDLPIDKKIPKIVWRGPPMINGQDLKLRRDFIAATQDKPWADVEEIDWQDKENLEAKLLPLRDYCRYMFTGHIDGLTWSGAAKFVHNCHSIFVTHKLHWAEIYHSALVSSGPHQNYIEAKNDWSDLEDIVKDLLANPQKARWIADNSAETLRDRYLTPAAEACYWRKLIRGYRSVSYEPDMYEEDGKTWRGAPFESVAMLRVVNYDPH